jgi:hypothetical protein
MSRTTQSKVEEALLKMIFDPMRLRRRMLFLSAILLFAPRSSATAGAKQHDLVRLRAKTASFCLSSVTQTRGRDDSARDRRRTLQHRPVANRKKQHLTATSFIRSGRSSPCWKSSERSWQRAAATCASAEPASPSIIDHSRSSSVRACRQGRIVITGAFCFSACTNDGRS